MEGVRGLPDRQPGLRTKRQEAPRRAILDEIVSGQR